MDREEKQYGSRRLPIILTKPETEKSGSDKSEFIRSSGGNMTSSCGSALIKMKQSELNSCNQSQQDRPQSQPTIILRTRESDNKALSINQKNTPRLKKENEPQPLSYQLVTKPSNTENNSPLFPLPEMKSSIKLIDDSFTFSDSALEYLTDQNDYTVIGIIGLQGVGKSTILSDLTENRPPEKRQVFYTQSFEQQESGSHCTNGIDMYVTQNRLILLDSQPVLSASVMDMKKAIRTEGPPSINNSCPIDISLPENSAEVSSLQIAAFMLSVCHIVIVLQDWFYDPNLLRFLQSAEMLKPPTPTTSQDEELVEYFPHILFVHSFAETCDFKKERIAIIQNVYSKIFARSRLHIQTGLGISNANILNSIKFSTDSVNLFLLPDFSLEEEDDHFKAHPGYKELINTLREQIHGATTNPLTHTSLSEKNWLHYAVKIWDGIKKATFFHEYSRLMP